MKVEGRHAEIDETRLAVSKFKFCGGESAPNGRPGVP